MKSWLFGPVFVFTLTAQAAVLLPLQTLRDQATTAHCWAYASGHMLESRAQVRESVDFMFDTERDSNYWVDYERMMFMWRSKSGFYLSIDYEGGWQIEYLQAFYRHGKNLLRSQTGNAAVWYTSFESYEKALPFMPVERPTRDRTLPIERDIVTKLTGKDLVTEAEAKAYIIDILNRLYGTPTMKTNWFGSTIEIKETPALVFGADEFKGEDSFVLVKPTEDGNYGWGGMILDRFQGVRMERAKVLELIKSSLTQEWPVTFDNVYHAMTIIGFDTKDGVDHYAVADSIPGKITWYDSDKLLMNLNLVTFYRAVVKDQLPTRTKKVKWAKGFDSDKYDYIDRPPGSR